MCVPVVFYSHLVKITKVKKKSSPNVRFFIVEIVYTIKLTIYHIMFFVFATWCNAECLFEGLRIYATPYKLN